MGGRAAMRCNFDAQGALSDCRVMTETPAGEGFGKALLSLAPLYRLSPDKAKRLPDHQITVVGEWPLWDHPPSWRRKPRPEQLLAVWPREALRRGLNGYALINCLIAPQGGLYDCLVIEEKPVGNGFGAAVIALTPQLLMNPPLHNGQPTFGSVAIPVSFSGLQPPQQPTLDPSGPAVASVAGAWAATPASSDLAAAYPEAARRARASGHVALSCSFRKDGTLRDCAVLEETPKGLGFAKAAMAISARFRFETTPYSPDRLAHMMLTLPISFDAKVLEGDNVTGKPALLETPSVGKIREAMAQSKIREFGRASMGCTVLQDGRLTACQTISEEPRGVGLGATLLALQPDFRLSAWTLEGLPMAGATVTVPFRFELAEEPSAPTPPAASPTPSRSAP